MSCPQCNGRLEQGIVRVQRRIWLGLLGVGLIFAYFLTGSLLHDVAEGLERSLLPWWKLWMPLALLAVGGIAAVVRLRRPVCEACGAVEPAWLFSPLGKEHSAEILAQGATRRVFLRAVGAGGAAVAAGVGGVAVAVGRDRAWLPVARDFFLTNVEKTAPVDLPAWQGARQSRTTGAWDGPTRWCRTSRLARARSTTSHVARMAIERGITYFDTAPDYSDTASERVLGEAMKGHRDKMFIATKFCVRDGHLPNDTPVPKIIEAVEGSLKRLQTDHVDLIHIHSCDRLDRLMAPNIHEAFDRLKEQGKVRFLGVSTHTPNLEEIANAAIDSGRFDVMMLAYHFGMWPSFGHILEKAKEHDVGIVAMKTLKGAKHTNLADFREEVELVCADGVSLGALQSERLLPGGVHSSTLEQSTSTSTPRERRCGLRRGPAAALRRAHRRRLLPAALRQVPRLVRLRPADQRHPALPHVLQGLRLAEGRHAAVCQAGAERLGLRLMRRSVREHLPHRRAHPGEDDGRAPGADVPDLKRAGRRTKWKEAPENPDASNSLDP